MRKPLQKKRSVVRLSPQEIDSMEILDVKGEREGSNATEAECSKVPRVEDQIDVHTRLPLLDAKQDKKLQPKFMHETVPSELMEVFSVRFLEFEHHDLEQMYGCILIGALPTYVVFSRKDGEPLNIDRQGFVKLRGPNRVIEPSDCIDIYPHLFRYQACADQFEDNETELLWNNRIYGCFDTFMSRRVRSQFGEIEVNYAVYRSGVEAHVDVTLTGCQFPLVTVHGLIVAQNSKHGENSKSFLFNRDETEGVSVIVSPCKDRIAQLPLGKCKIAVPANSSLTVDVVNIWQCSNIGAPDQPIAENVKFDFVARLSGQEVKTFIGAACQVNVRVTWSHYT